MRIKMLLKTNEIHFENNHTARAVYSNDNDSVAEIIEALRINQPKNIILNIGGASNFDETNNSRLIQFFSRGIASVAIENESLLIDGGTDSGIMALMGLGVVDRGRKTNLLGIAPTGKVVYPDQPHKNAGKDIYPWSQTILILY